MLSRNLAIREHNMHHHSLPTREQLEEILSYEPETGIFRWKLAYPGRSRCRVVGDAAGTCGIVNIHTGELGYRIIPLPEFKMNLRAARVAWRMMTGDDPGALEVDHKNRVKSDDRWENLRLATRSQNAVNTSFRNKSGVRGVWQHGGTKKWCAKISRNGVHRLLGQAFLTIEEAKSAYDAADAAHKRGEW